MPVLGIDVGGTKTVCLLADEDERVLAEDARTARTSRAQANWRSRRCFTP